MSKLSDAVAGLFLRFAASGYIPASWFRDVDPNTVEKAKRSGKLSLEIVSHCWNYGHLLTYQLSALVNHPTDKLDITMTVFYAIEDESIKPVLEFFGKIEVPGVRWNWQPLPKEKIFRRSIGRNMAAKATQADWIWFTDCDIVFHEGCLETLARELQGRDDTLVFPLRDRGTELLEESDGVLSKGRAAPAVREIALSEFTILSEERQKAKGAFQIAHGDIARSCGYCEKIGLYQRPSDRWRKTYEDRAFKWLIGSQGTGLDIPSVCQIRHIVKGRYKKDSLTSEIRASIRKAQDP